MRGKPRRGPSTSAATSPLTPDATSTTGPPAKSSRPSLNSQPSGLQTQWASGAWVSSTHSVPEQRERREAFALDDAAADDRQRDDREEDLEHREQRRGDGAGQVTGHIAQARVAQTADQGVPAGPEGQGVPHGDPGELATPMAAKLIIMVFRTLPARTSPP